MEINLVAEGLKFMVLGMVTVFLFLILMVIVLNLQSKLVQKYFPASPVGIDSAKSIQNKSQQTEDDILIAVIGAAITKFRNKTT